MRGLRRRLAAMGEGGLAAIEFALVAPLLIIIYLGSAEVTMALMAYRKLGNAAVIAAELASHSPTIDATTASRIQQAATASLAPFDATNFDQRLTAVVVDAGGVARVEWSVGDGAVALAAGSVVTVPADLSVPDEGIVMAEAWLDYASPAAFAIPGNWRFTQTHFVYPRINDRVLWE
jgi:Flp pilus assembly protein TadG